MPSSDRMSKVSKLQPASRRAATVLALKPQRGASGVPFMNSSTGAEPSSLRMRSVSSGLCSAGWLGGVLAGAEVPVGTETAG